MAVSRLMRSALKSIVPNWLADRPELRNAYTVLYAGALLCDTLYEAAYEGWLATLPGLGTPTAYTYLSQARGLLQGPLEPDANFAVRLVAWLQTWLNAGQASIMATEIQDYLTNQGILGVGVVPEVRIVDRSGQWVTVDTNGNVTRAIAAFDWDEVTGFDDGVGHVPGSVAAGYWSDMWIVVAPPSGSSPIFTTYTGTADTTWLSNFGVNATLGLGHQVPLAVSNGVLQIVHVWKGAHTWIRALIFPTDHTSFTPGTPTADGTFGNCSKYVGGVQVPARTASARFWIPQVGG